MIEQLVLETAGFRFTFHADYQITDFIGEATEDKGYDLRMNVTFKLLPPLPELLVCSEPTLLWTSDFYKLIDYLEQHMKKLEEVQGDFISDPFINYELGFQLQALEGIFEIPLEDFSLSCQVVIGKTAEGERVYVGGTSSVTVEQIQAFISDLQAFLAELPTLYLQNPQREEILLDIQKQAEAVKEWFRQNEKKKQQEQR